MLRAARLGKRIIPFNSRSCVVTSLSFSSSSPTTTAQPNPRLDLDPSLQALLQDVDMALHSHPKKLHASPRELEVLDKTQLEPLPIDYDQEDHESLPRKSPAALFGSQRIGTVVLPLELQDTIKKLISDANKSQLHSDARRLFQQEGDEERWEPQYEKKYRTGLQAVKHAKRDGTAFASVVLPAHYSAIFAVLDHVKQRLGPSWTIERILDWGAGTGSGLWASLYSFQIPSQFDTPMEELSLTKSTIRSYVGIEKRDGLSGIGRRLFHGAESGHISISWQKSWRQEDNVAPEHGSETVAMSAFYLTTLADDHERRKLVKDIWQSGANTIILIDHNSKEGFEAIAAAREYLLDLGRQEAQNQTASTSSVGSHVLAPCPHDGVCPLFFPDAVKLVCGFSQRIQRPDFVRQTKHSKLGHEDIQYSYVVIQRGPRPQPMVKGLGRIGAVGKRALEKGNLKKPIRELTLHDEHKNDEHINSPQDVPLQHNEEYAAEQIEEALRLEAYEWPRLVFPPLKKNGHIIVDGCTAEAKIMRMTIPKSQGKQAFYDARKSSWGDIFPHPPKNKPQERQHMLKPRKPGSDVDKRRDSNQNCQRIAYEEIAKAINEDRKKSRRDARLARDSFLDHN